MTIMQSEEINDSVSIPLLTKIKDTRLQNVLPYNGKFWHLANEPFDVIGGF